MLLTHSAPSIVSISVRQLFRWVWIIRGVNQDAVALLLEVLMASDAGWAGLWAFKGVAISYIPMTAGPLSRVEESSSFAVSGFVPVGGKQDVSVECNRGVRADASPGGMGICEKVGGTFERKSVSHIFGENDVGKQAMARIF